jgi:SAM-dependent methyltransferase
LRQEIEIIMTWREHTLEELWEMSNAVGERSGWDFSRMATEREPVPWDYQDIVTRYLEPSDAVLDIGTGGAERLLALAPRFQRAVGIDPEPLMIQTAIENGRNTPSVAFRQMAAESLDFPDATFDLVLTRHAPMYVPELERVTRPGGRFISQGIGGRNMANIRHAFATGSAPRYDEEHAQVIADLRSHGWNVRVTGMYDVTYWVKDLPSLIFWFKAIAGAAEVPADFSVDRHANVINTLISRYAGSRGFETNEHRTLLVASKPAR